MSVWQRIKKLFRKYLAKMEEANKQAFREKPLDCCSLNRTYPTKKRG